MGNAHIGGTDTVEGVPKFFHIKPPTYRMITKWGIDPLYHTGNATVVLQKKSCIHSSPLTRTFQEEAYIVSY